MVCIHEGRKGDPIEVIAEYLPELNAVALLALVIETVDPTDSRRLVVVSDNEEILRVLDLVRREQADRLWT